MEEAALGFRVHSGWALVAAVAGPAAAPRVLCRRRVELSRRTPRQPFHAAEGRPFAAAARLIEGATREAAALAEGAVGEAVLELRAAGAEAVAAGLLVSAGRALPDLRAVLASHALIHAAEGQMFRDVIRQASRSAGLRLEEVRERDLEEEAVRGLRRSAVEVRAWLSGWGKALGSPWTQDEKRAALVAWLALGGRREM